MVAILRYQREHILEAVRAMYTEVAANPQKVFHFPTGRCACLLVGYPESELERLPPGALESFAGVGYPFLAGAVGQEDVVLDVGSGSGTDTLIASLRVGPRGKVYALDMTEAMLHKLRGNVREMGAGNVEALSGNAEDIPLPDASVSAVTSNGVLNLVPDKRRAFSEIFRVLAPGGRLQIADIAVGHPASAECRDNPRLWAECIVGALPEEDYLDALRMAGFTGVAVLARLDYFALSSSAETRHVAQSLNAHSIVLRASKPQRGGAGLGGRVLSSLRIAWRNFP
ncbi:MAG TPA: methyltransferase domain-containing protein [Burkholderiales bacterium]|jgi:arsenite methyltransferase|nr:methyltransferase domain-containing protein [Burkholderiales bacterium]